MTITVRQALAQAAKLAAVTSTPRLDAEVLLAHVLQRPRSWLFSWPDHSIDESLHASFTALLARRAQGEPVAYLIGQQAFWTLELLVTPAVLIPRPETELLVEQALGLGPGGVAQVVDLGTGSGAIALALATERPAWRITATDCSVDALDVAADNARRLGVTTVTFSPGSWCDALQPGTYFDLIVSNPPYIEPDDDHLQHRTLTYEPRIALVAAEDGLADIRVICGQARGFLRSGGFLLLEHGYDQGDRVRAIMTAAGYCNTETIKDLAGHDRVTRGQWNTDVKQRENDHAG